MKILIVIQPGFDFVDLIATLLQVTDMTRLTVRLPHRRVQNVGVCNGKTAVQQMDMHISGRSSSCRGYVSIMLLIYICIFEFLFALTVV